MNIIEQRRCLTCSSCGVIVLRSHFIEVICSFPFFCMSYRMRDEPSTLKARTFLQETRPMFDETCPRGALASTNTNWHRSKILVIPPANIQRCQFGRNCFEHFEAKGNVGSICRFLQTSEVRTAHFDVDF